MSNKKRNNSSSKKNNYNGKKNYNKSTNYNRKEEDFSVKKIDENLDIRNKKLDKEEIFDDTSLKNKKKDIDMEIKEPDIKKKNNKHVLIHSFLVILLISSLVFFGISINDKETSVNILINNLLLTLFTILFVCICITYNKKKKGTIFISGLLLFSYFLLNINNTLGFYNPITEVPDFSGKSLTSVTKWAMKNDISLKQQYEYSDMVSEYKIISQDIPEGTNLNNMKELTISISEGPSPYKEIIVPSMIGWDSERVINFVKDNYLSNVLIEFVESEKDVDTVIEQSTSGNLSRDDEIKLTFSYGEELGYDEYKLIDFTGKSKFEVEFFMKQHKLKYEFDYDFSKKIKKGYITSQEIKAGEMVKVDDTVVKVTVSKGPKIKVPDLAGMSMTEVTEWAIKNKLKLEFSDRYDDSIKENNVISVNYKKNDIVEQGTVIKIVISRGTLKMPKFESFEDFRVWADKYEIRYEEEHEFSDSIKAGDVIKFSYKTGDIIKNNDTIIVTISDGEKITVPNLKGLNKNEAIQKLKAVGLKYNFITKSSDSIKKNYVINQSMKAGSEVSEGATITVTISSGPSTNNKPTKPSRPSGGNDGNTSIKPEEKPDEKPEPPSCDKSKGAVLNIQAGSSGSQTKSMILQMNPNHKFAWNEVVVCPNGDTTPGTVCTTGLEGVWKNFCDSIYITIVR